MVVQCPFCKTDWAENVIGSETVTPAGSPEACEPFQCDCGAWWYEGMEDEEDD